mmetsp:Transcript_38559/g.28436  ORF Transcript_38559/g.28436 Transcript_38559/m.28436 type:complete len:80 (+) Transcript_38559:2256-2495(+)
MKTWCKQEVEVAMPKQVFWTTDDLNKESPPLVALTLAMKMARSKNNTNEIAMLSFIVHQHVSQEGTTEIKGLQNMTLVR